MEASTRGDAFAQLMTGAKFNKKRFKKDIEKFDPKLKSPTIQPQKNPPHLKKLNFFEDKDQSEGGMTDLGSEIAAQEVIASNPAAKPAPKPGKQKSIEIRKTNHIKASGENVPPPMVEFTSATTWYKLPGYLGRNLFERNFHVPTPIQMQALPCLFEGRNFIGVAPTGSGKTLAFLLPMLARLKKPNKKGLRGLIIAHSKELASQSERELRYLSKGVTWGIQTMASTKAQVGKQDILCTTPGRLMSFVKDQSLDLSKVEYIVFDEADQLFDISHDSFFGVMKSVLEKCTTENKQIVVMSATLPEKAEGIIRQFLPQPCRIMIGTRASASKNVDQQLEYCGKEQGKIQAVRQLLQKGLAPPVLVFVQSIERAKDLYLELVAKDLSVASIHSDRTPAQREKTVKEFRMGRINVLVCTELLARGIDFKGVATVINYDFPTSIQSYVHRVGRTGRAGHKGTAITLWTDEDRPNLRRIANIVKSAGTEVPEWMLKVPKKFGKTRGTVKKQDEMTEDQTAAYEAKVKSKAKSSIMPVNRESISAIRRVKEAEARNKRSAKRKRKGDDDAGPMNVRARNGKQSDQD
eukprot:TRINITY_DN11309_c0_g1_i1.p1 TRINITY_DN11309_c0_g1~~TRINITY_DN11309_c0_g1_i1.p1  ORF type:complete len:610 (+),score=106.82 TRINITY_DN11309_c0_g1_i1:96-1832(+)